MKELHPVLAVETVADEDTWGGVLSEGNGKAFPGEAKLETGSSGQGDWFEQQFKLSWRLTTTLELSAPLSVIKRETYKIYACCPSDPCSLFRWHWAGRWSRSNCWSRRE